MSYPWAWVFICTARLDPRRPRQARLKRRYSGAPTFLSMKTRRIFGSWVLQGDSRSAPAGATPLGAPRHPPAAIKRASFHRSPRHVVWDRRGSSASGPASLSAHQARQLEVGLTHRDQLAPGIRSMAGAATKRPRSCGLAPTRFPAL